MINLKNIPVKSTKSSFLFEIDFKGFAAFNKGRTEFVRPAAREGEIESMRLALMSGNSCWLLGEEGVGKTTLISGLLQKVANKEVGPSLLSKKFFIFSSHAFFKTEPKEQFTKFDEAMVLLGKQPSILIFDRFDDFIMTVDSKYYANAFVDGLSDSVQAIIASQWKNKGCIHEASTGFAPTFVEQRITSPSKEDLLFMLRANRSWLEAKHDVVIPEDTIKEVVRINSRYPGRAFSAPWPQGPMDFLEKTAAYVRMSCYNLSPEIMNKTERLLQLQDEKDSILASSRPLSKRVEEISSEIEALEAIVKPARSIWEQKFKPYTDTLNEISEREMLLSEINEREKVQIDGEMTMTPINRKEYNENRSLLKKLQTRAEELAEALHADRAVVGKGDAQKVFAKATGLAMADISGDERARLLGAEAEIGKYVFGQPEAINAVANILRAARSGNSDPDRPAGVIFLTGPTGVGKTEIAKALAIVDGGEGAKPIIFPMNKFKSETAVSEFRGASAGYVGYSEEGPKALQQIRKNSRAIVDFDEIEKAYDDLFDVIMTIIDEGQMEDASENVISFKDTIIIFTSNVVLPEDIIEHSDDSDEQLKILRDAVKYKINPKTGRPFFKPEFIERLDMIVMLDYLDIDAAKSILFKQVANQNRTLETKNYKLIIDAETVSRLMDKIFKKGSNGRTVRQFFNSRVRPLITNFLLSDTNPPHENEDAKNIYILYDGENVKLSEIL